MEVLGVDPFVMGGGIPFPSDEVLFLLHSPIESFSEYLLYFPLLFSFDNIRWWFDKIWDVLIGFFVWCQQGDMEDIVYFLV